MAEEAAAREPEQTATPSPTTRSKLVKIGELAVDHVLALLEKAEPGTLNAHQLKTTLQLLRDARVAPTEADAERERAERDQLRKSLSTPFPLDDDDEELDVGFDRDLTRMGG